MRADATKNLTRNYLSGARFAVGSRHRRVRYGDEENGRNKCKLKRIFAYTRDVDKRKTFAKRHLREARARKSTTTGCLSAKKTKKIKVSLNIARFAIRSFSFVSKAETIVRQLNEVTNQSKKLKTIFSKMCVNKSILSDGLSMEARPINRQFTKHEEDVEKVFISDFLAETIQYTRKSMRLMMTAAGNIQNTAGYK
jgi:hypothetical protein